MLRRSLLPALAVFVLSAAPAFAQEGAYSLVIRGNKFVPDTLEVKAGEKFRITVRNMDSSPEEFESSDLKFEKVIPGGGSATVVVQPLKPGTYTFVGEFHPNTAKGKVIAK
jgi:plastocyanin